MPVLRGIVPALLVACALGTAIGCSSSSDSGGSTPDGGSPTGEGGPGTDGGGPGPGTDGGDGGASCTVNGTDVLANEPKQLSNLEIAGTSLVFLSVPPGAAPPASIEKMGLDGANRTSLYTSAGDRRIHSMHVQGDTIYFFEEDNAAPDPKDELWSMPVAGGTPTQVGTFSFGSGPRFIGSDAANIYLSGETVGGDNTFDRVVLASSTVENVALLPNHGTINMARISGSDIFFWSSSGSSTIVNDIYHFDKSATAATPAAVPGHLEAVCDITTAGMFLTPTKIGCGASGLNVMNHDGTGVQSLIPKNLAALGPYTIVGADAETFYTYDRGKAFAPGGISNISKISSAGGTLTPVACNVQTIQNHLVNASFPIATEFEVVVGATDIYWIEKHLNATTGVSTYALRKAPK